MSALRDVAADYLRMRRALGYKLEIQGLLLAGFGWMMELILERQGFRIVDRFGSADGSDYVPTPSNIQPQFVVVQLMP